jgi:predicted negative regulator of RcsB-dependent stress response
MADVKNLEHATRGDIPEELQQLKEWWKAHGDLTSTVVLIVLICFAGWKFYDRWQTSKKRDADIAYGTATRAEDLEAVIDNHKNAPVAPLAQLRLASDYYHRQNYEQALEAYDRFLSKHASHLLALQAHMGRAHTLEATGKFDDANAIYLQVKKDHPEHYYAHVATLGTARIAAFRGNKDDARVILQLMLAECAGTSWGGFADELLAALPRLEFVAPQMATIPSFDNFFNMGFGE